MRFIPRHLQLVAVAASCTALGAGASAIASAGAAAPASAHAHHRGHPGTLLGRAVHGDVVLATKTGFATATFDRGFVQSVSGAQLTLREGTRTRTYRTVTLTIPAGGRVRVNGRSATLGALRAGQHVLVWQGPNRTTVVARTPRKP